MNYYAWLALTHAYVSVKELGVLIERFDDVENIARQSNARLLEAGLSDVKAKRIAAPDDKAIGRAMNWLESDRHALLAFGNDDYPALLSEISGPPLMLFVNGNVEALHLPSLAIVGSRNPTAGGAKNAAQFSHHLAANGYNIVSGLAEGVDTAAHRGALESGGSTVALLGHGIDRVYPAQNHELAHHIAESGALVSEYPLGAPPDRHHFPERNRIISGLSLGTLVVEAARRSGSLITARFAAEQGREVFALPGSIHNPLSRGCHELIRQGATLTESANDIAAGLGLLTGHLQQNLAESTPNKTPLANDNDDYVKLRGALGFDPVTIDDLGCQSGLTIDQLSSMLLILELQGEVEALSGGRYALIA